DPTVLHFSAASGSRHGSGRNHGVWRRISDDRRTAGRTERIAVEPEEVLGWDGGLRGGRVARGHVDLLARVTAAPALRTGVSLRRTGSLHLSRCRIVAALRQ